MRGEIPGTDPEGKTETGGMKGEMKEEVKGETIVTTEKTVVDNVEEEGTEETEE